MDDRARFEEFARLATEQRNPRTTDLDTLDVAGVLARISAEDRTVPEIVAKELPYIAAAVELVIASFREGGQLIYVGAGTSGRLGVLEAAEMPPTFGLTNGVVRAIMAGGKAAVHRAREGVEDDEQEGGRALGTLRPGRKDAVIGVSASGVTPFVRGALLRARREGAHVIGITCSRASDMPKLVDVLVELNVGPEVIAGSTRLKAGTATKVVLNAISTTAFVLLGKTYGGLMVDVRPTNAKLWARATRIVRALSGLPDADALKLLEKAGGRAKVALVMHHAQVNAARAKELLVEHKGSLRAIVGDIPMEGDVDRQE